MPRSKRSPKDLYPKDLQDVVFATDERRHGLCSCTGHDAAARRNPRTDFKSKTNIVFVTGSAEAQRVRLFAHGVTQRPDGTAFKNTTNVVFATCERRHGLCAFCTGHDAAARWYGFPIGITSGTFYQE